MFLVYFNLILFKNIAWKRKQDAKKLKTFKEYRFYQLLIEKRERTKKCKSYSTKKKQKKNCKTVKNKYINATSIFAMLVMWWAIRSFSSAFICRRAKSRAVCVVSLEHLSDYSIFSLTDKQLVKNKEEARYTNFIRQIKNIASLFNTEWPACFWDTWQSSRSSRHSREPLRASQTCHRDNHLNISWPGWCTHG